MLVQLSESQEDIIELKGKNILKACPGSGKTFVIAHKVVHDFKLWKNKNKGMAILSFTNVAKNELDAKIREISGLNTIPFPHYIGTLDSFISKYIFMPFGHTVMKGVNRPSIIDDDFINRYSAKIWKYECYSNGCDAKNFYIDTEGNIYDSKKNFENCPFTKDKPCVKFKLSAYSKGYTTYKEALLIAINILQKYSDIRNLIINRFPYFIVDEAQDTSEEQMQLLNLLFDDGVENAILIGDPDQAIYEWRDADPSVFMNIYNGGMWEAKELNENFRCSQHICNATKMFSSLSDISIARGDTKDCLLKPVIMKYHKGDREVLIENYVGLCMKNNITVTPDKVAVLVRGRSGLTTKDYSKINDLWQTPLTLYFAQATFYKGIEKVQKTITIIEKILYYIIFDDQTNIIEFSTIQKKYSADNWNYLVFKLSTLLPDSNLPLKSWKIEISDVINKFILDNKIQCKNNVEIKTKSRVQNNDLKDFLEQPIEIFFADSYQKDYLNTTIHAVKGCTFDAVMLIINTNGKLTSNIINTKDIDSEEIRTFYVAATRAKKLFVLALPDTIKDKTLTRFPVEYWDFK